MENTGINKKTRKQIIIVFIAGLLLIAADLIASEKNNDIKIVEDGGKLYLLRPEEGEKRGHIALRVTVRSDGDSFEKKMNIMLEPEGSRDKKEKAETSATSEVTERERAEQELRLMSSEFNQRSGNKIMLPSELKTGESITWEKERNSNTLVIALCTLALAFLIYRSRFSEIEKKRRENRESVMRRLPEFVNKLVLLLNAGLVLNSAFEKIVDESTDGGRFGSDYFYGRLREIRKSMSESNGSMEKEFRNFARESGVKELMRISGIISDNINKGAGLTDKLKIEGELLWMERKKNCEALGKMAETKLTLPLVIFLMVLIVITVSPALMEL